MGKNSGGPTKSRAGRSPALRVRDVVVPAVTVVVLLGVGGCMGAYGGGPFGGGPPDDDTSAASPSPSATAPTAPEPSFVAVDPDEGTPEYLFGFAEKLRQSKESGAAPEAFVNRTPLFSCGEFVLGQGAPMPRGGWDCLAEHVETGAELVEVTPTVVGDPVIRYYRVGPGIDGLEYFADPTFDKFGASSWTHLVCELDTENISASLSSCPWDEVE